MLTRNIAHPTTAHTYAIATPSPSHTHTYTARHITRTRHNTLRQPVLAMGCICCRSKEDVSSEARPLLQQQLPPGYAAPFLPFSHGETEAMRIKSDLCAQQRQAVVRSLPIIEFGQGRRSEDCVICMTEFRAGDELRCLPCLHKYHSACVDPWLLLRVVRCPICGATPESWH
jgi:hypothetical protein